MNVNVNTLAAAIVFTLAAVGATADDAGEICDAIRDNFGITDGGIDPASIPTTPATQGNTDAAATPTTGQVLDKDGIPWDERIHASSKAQNKDGTWRNRKGVPESTFNKVMKELKATLAAAPAPAAAIASIPAPASSPAVAAGIPVPGQGAVTININAAAPAPLPLPQPPAQPIDPNYAELVKLIAAHTHSAENPTGRITDDYVKQLLTHYGIADGSMQNLAHRLDLVPTILAGLKTVLGIA